MRKNCGEIEFWSDMSNSDFWEAIDALSQIRPFPSRVLMCDKEAHEFCKRAQKEKSCTMCEGCTGYRLTLEKADGRLGQ